jgi:uncharacterized ferritin-like protein (DUF455 family)
MTSPFTLMAETLAKHQPVPVAASNLRIAGIDRCNGKTEALRHALAHGAFNAKDLAQMAGLANSGLVYALLKVDISKGLIVHTDGVYRRAYA